jgi:hypothetical protein
MRKGLLGQSDGGASVKQNASTNFDRMPAVHMPVNVPQSDKTLGDYIQRKIRGEAFTQVVQENRLTFNEWVRKRFPNGVDGYAGMLNMGDLEQCWKAAQENT